MVTVDGGGKFQAEEDGPIAPAPWPIVWLQVGRGNQAHVTCTPGWTVRREPRDVRDAFGETEWLVYCEACCTMTVCLVLHLQLCRINGYLGCQTVRTL